MWYAVFIQDGEEMRAGFETEAEAREFLDFVEHRMEREGSEVAAVGVEEALQASA